jgi:hypothetical protein
MKKILLLFTAITLCSITSPLDAQSRELTNRHQIRFGVGAAWYPEYGYHHDSNLDYSVLPGKYRDDYYKGDLIGTPAINLSYSYQFKHWLSFGATLTYEGQYQNNYDLYTDAVYSKRRQHFVGLTPTVRFDWFRTNTVKLYSVAGLGIGFGSDKWEYASKERTYNENSVVPTIDFTPIGISVGRNFFGFCELGLSTLGIVKAGVGYRFKDKSGR